MSKRIRIIILIIIILEGGAPDSLPPLSLVAICALPELVPAWSRAKRATQRRKKSYKTNNNNHNT